MFASFFRRSEPLSHSFPSMGGLATVTVAGASPQGAEAATMQVRGIFEELERELSTYRPDSSITLLAKDAGVNSVPVSENASRLLRQAQHFGQLSEGVFDVTVAPVAGLWGLGGTAASSGLPTAEEIQDQMRLVDYRRVILRDRTAFLPEKGMAVDLGGIAKGFAVDRAFDACRSAGFRDFLIDLSGNIRVSGRPRRGEGWLVGVRDPFDRLQIVGKILLRSGTALATSGSYERFVEIASMRYSHIIDPRTGYPVEGTAGVTVLAPDATSADYLSTLLFIVGLNGAGKALQEAPPADFLIVPDEYPVKIWLTPGLAEAFIPMPELSNALKILTPTST